MSCAPALYGRKGSLKSRLAAGERVYGAFLCSQSPFFAEMMGLAGYDYVVIDLEHGPGDTISALPCVHALEAVGTPAIIRVAWNDKVLLKKALDLGPSGVIVPMVENAKEAAQAVASCRYPPVGVRGAAFPLVRASRFGLDKTYLDTVEKDLLIICQIESESGVDNVKEIAEVDGVDGLMVGPRDLSASVGCLAEPAHPHLAAVMRKAEQAVLASRRKVVLKGIARSVIDAPPALFGRGYQMVTGVVDINLFTSAAVADVKAHKPPALSLPSPLTPFNHINGSPHSKISNGTCNGTSNGTCNGSVSNGLSNGTGCGAYVSSHANGASNGNTHCSTAASATSNGVMTNGCNATSISSHATSDGPSLFAVSNGTSHSTNGVTTNGSTSDGSSLFVVSNGTSHSTNGVMTNGSNATTISPYATSDGPSLFAVSNGTAHSTNGVCNGTSQYSNGCS